MGFGTLATGPSAPSRASCSAVRVLIFHGYLLRGTGSNVYNAELAAALRRAGHEGHLLSQEPHPASLPRGAPPRGAPPWGARAGRGRGGGLGVAVRREPVRATVYRPDIGRLLPVYV